MIIFVVKPVPRLHPISSCIDPCVKDSACKNAKQKCYQYLNQKSPFLIALGVTATLFRLIRTEWIQGAVLNYAPLNLTGVSTAAIQAMILDCLTSGQVFRLFYHLRILTHFCP